MVTDGTSETRDETEMVGQKSLKKKGKLDTQNACTTAVEYNGRLYKLARVKSKMKDGSIPQHHRKRRIRYGNFS